FHVGVEGIAERRADHADRVRSAVDAAPREVALRAEHELADLIVEADLSAAEEAVALVRDVEAERIAPVLLGPAVADVAADIESGPVISDRQRAGGRRLVDRPGDIRGERGAAENRQSCQHKQITDRALMHILLRLESRAPRDRSRPGG